MFLVYSLLLISCLLVFTITTTTAHGRLGGYSCTAVSTLKEHIFPVDLDDTFSTNPTSANSPIQLPRKTQWLLSHLHGGATSNNDKVHTITSLSELNKLFASKRFMRGRKLIVLDFTASWCGPCQKIAPVYKELAETKEFSSVLFVKIDVDEAPDVAQEYQISAMPTFLLLSTDGDHRVLTKVMGANSAALIQAIRSHNK